MTNPTPEAIEALVRARDLAMDRAARARIPECADFGAISQDLDAALTALSQRQRVKPLVWELEPDRDAEYPKWSAETGLGKSYHVFKAWWGAQNKWAFIGIDGFHHSEEEAKAAAHADYEDRILSALEADPTVKRRDGRDD